MEQIGIRECGRRLGVSDTAVHKAIKTGRVTIAGRTPASNRPLVGWPLVRDQWQANTNEGYRTHIGEAAQVTVSHKPPPGIRQRQIVGSKPKPEPKPKPVKPAKPEKPAAAPKPTPTPKPAPDVPREAPPDVLPPASAPVVPEPQTGPSYAQSRAIREAYQARLAKLEYEEKSGKLVPVDQVKADAFNAARQVRDALLNISGRIAHQLAHEKDPARISARIDDEIREALSGLAAG